MLLKVNYKAEFLPPLGAMPLHIDFHWLQEHRLEIDARSGTFQSFEMFGNQLLQNNHYASDEVRAKLDELAKARIDLEQ